uniref:Pecanex-like protein n=1 Tax=Macrostomum lignano TaxID=282301 RepID=A0A1I8F638_9PLAT
MLSWYPAADLWRLTEPEFLDLCPTLVYLLHSRLQPARSTADPASRPVAPGRSWAAWPPFFISAAFMRTRFYTLVVQFLIALAVGLSAVTPSLHLLPHRPVPRRRFTNTTHKEERESGGLDHMATMYRCLTAPDWHLLFLRDRANHRAVPRTGAAARRSSSRRPRVRHLRGGSGRGSEAAEAAADDLTVEFLHDCNRLHRQRSRSAAAAANASRQRHQRNNARAAASAPACLRQPRRTSSKQRNNHHTDNQHNDSEKPKDAGPRGGRPGIRAHQPVHQRRFRRPPTAASRVAGGPAGSTRRRSQLTFDDDRCANGDDADESEGRGARARAHGHSHSHTTGAGLDCHHWTDGLHNFCDGMALGAARSPRCRLRGVHRCGRLLSRLPHELADFAVLLQAGMSVRMPCCEPGVQPVCLLGHGLPVCLLARVPTNWVFMVTAGSFCYICSGDMMPETSPTEKSSRGPGPCVRFFCRIWASHRRGIMLLISLYEHKIIKLAVWLIKQSMLLVLLSLNAKLLLLS